MRFMRRLILISNPGREAEGNYQPTTASVIDRFENFFKSNIGGKWENREIDKYGENRPLNVDEMHNIMAELDSQSCEYSMIVFCGHGGAAGNGEDGIQLPRTVDVQTPNCFPISRLISQNEANDVRHRIKRTVILDACRTIIPVTPQQLFEGDIARQVLKLDGDLCRQRYNEIIAQNMPHVELLQSTSPNAPAHATRMGSEYADQVFRIVNEQTSLWHSRAIINNHFVYSMRNLHNDVLTNIANTTRRQIPQFRIIGDESIGFPFAAICSPHILI